MVKLYKVDKNKLIEIAKDSSNKSNKELYEALGVLHEEYEKTKTLIIDLTRHLDSIESLYNNVNSEIDKRLRK